jgi:phosphoserine phosphatase
VSGASRAVLLTETLDQTFQKMLDLIFENLPVQRGFIMLREGEERTLVTKCVRQAGGPGGPGGNISFSRTIAEKVCKDKVAVLTMDAQADDRFSSGESIMALGIRSAMAAPLWNGERVDGLICVDTSVQTMAFDEFDLDLLSALGNHLAIAVEQARLQSVALEKERLEHDLSMARDIQMAFLPSTMPPCDGYDVAGTSRPAEQTGGDVFDVVPLGGESLMLLLGDATGHGIGPALSVTQVRSMLRMAVRLGANLDAAFMQINNQLAQDLADNRFVTAFLGVLDSTAHEVRYHAGGQAPMLHFRAATGECDWLKATTMPLGFMETESLSEAHSIRLAEGDILGLITDGVFEFENPREEQFQTDRAAEVVRAHHDGPMNELVLRLLEAVDDFGETAAQNDDITIVLVRRLPQ